MITKCFYYTVLPPSCTATWSAEGLFCLTRDVVSHWGGGVNTLFNYYGKEVKTLILL